MFILAHLSDPHLAPLPTPDWVELFSKRITGYINWWRKRRFIHERGVLDTLTADLKAQNADHIAVTGDIVNIAAQDEFPPGRAFLESLGDSKAVSYVPGNHDIYVRSGAFQNVKVKSIRGADGRGLKVDQEQDSIPEGIKTEGFNDGQQYGYGNNNHSDAVEKHAHDQIHDHK